MNQTQAIAVLKKIIGPKFGYRVDPKAPDVDERERRRAAMKEAADAVRAADAARVERLNAVLAADAEYQRLKAEHAAARKRHEQIPSPYHKRVTVGRVSSMFFSVVADGDNWQEVVAAVKTKAQ